MHRNAVALTVLAGLAGTSVTAFADPAPIKLSKAQLRAAEKAQVAKLPPVDKAQGAQCQKSVDAYNANPSVTPLMAAAACWRSAGALSAAIQLWNAVEYGYRNTPEAKEALHELGPAYEAAGLWSKAADEDDEYARRYPAEHDARDLEVRAVCTWEQLGYDDESRKALYYLTKEWPKLAVDAHLCDAIRPIPVVAP